ncbi:Ig-like domain-containing protein [Agromyces sp. G08B096]|uniref:Ig-like domain-containing protein n=1 Tax=Agromyces sp. G08B096 TaxID=3156399 RepID=A0AAU7W3R5_9MICO
MPRLEHRRSAVITALAVTALVGVVGGVAVASDGYRAEQVELGDGAVWVVNDARQAIGRASTMVRELNAAVETGANRVDLVQRGPTVLAVDADHANVSIVDPATATVVDTVAVPPDDPVVAIGGGQVVVADGGDIRTIPAADFAEFDAAADPSLSFGPGAVVSVDADGRIFAYRPSTGDIAEVDAAASTSVARRWQVDAADDAAEAGTPPQITSVGGRWAVFDPQRSALLLDGRTVELDDVIRAGDAPVLQAPSIDGSVVALATRRGLVVVPLDGGVPREVVDDRGGLPAQPVRHRGCLHAAWADGTAWRDCPGAEPIQVQLERGAGAASLTFRANEDALVLNDARTGRSWAAAEDHALIDDWDRLLADDRDEQTVERNDPTTPPTVETAQVPPVAEDDALGARPGRASLLPVLLNDYDANGDVLAIEGVDAVLPPGVRLDVVSERQQLQLTLDERASGTLTFGYTVTDGRGGTDAATVVVEVRGPDENGPPEQRRSTTAAVSAGGRVTVPVLGEWVDPDGDPFFLREARTAEPDRVTSTADGVVVFDERTGAGGTRSVALVVDDGRSAGAGVLDVDVPAAGPVPLVAEPFIALATAGEEVAIEPLRHVRGGSGTVRLIGVPGKPDATLVADFDRGVFRFSSEVARTHLVEYTVTDGVQTAVGQVRVEVETPPDRDPTPITVPHTAFVRVGQDVEVDVLATDIDPIGGVLLLTGVDAEGTSQVRAELIEHRVIRIALLGPLEQGSVEIGYRVSNGLAEADGRVTVVEVPPPAQPQPPVAVPDRVSARTGDVVDIPVLANDEHPDGDPLALAPELVQQPDRGFAFTSGDRVRYLAPDEPGEYRAEYRVDGPDHQYATAVVEISVREADPVTNTAPAPVAVTARALAGETVRIPIPLAGVDPDGDSVQLLGEYSAPERGTVLARGADWLEYRAGEYSPGTDDFRYEVMDALGGRATGSVRVGIAPRPDGARAPVAASDALTVRPGRTVAVRVLENDSDPDGGALTITAVEATGGDATAEIGDGVILVDVPDAEGTFSFQYTIENEQLATASSYLRIDAVADAALTRPEATDVVLGLSDILDRDVVDVDVLDAAFIADASVSRADVGLVDGYDDAASVRGDGRVRVEVQDRRRIIPFTISHPDDPSLVATAFIQVPGRDDAVPQLRADAPRVRVDSGETVELDLADFVIAASGRPVRLTDAASVRASHSDGGSLVIDADTLRFRSEAGYFGPASISFAATDGESPDDPRARTGTIVIPIEVRPAEGVPPAFMGAVVDLQPDQSKRIALAKLTNRADAKAASGLEFSIGDLPDGFSASLDGTMLTVRADGGARYGLTAALPVSVSDAEGAGTPGTIQLRVVPSTRPLAEPVPDTAVAERGRTTQIDVLANDQAGNPFPGTPLEVIGVAGADARSLPAGVRVSPSGDRSKLTVTVSPSAEPANTTLQYQVADATGDPSRFAWGTVTISVQDRPDPVTNARVTGFGDGRLDVAFGAGAANNSPIRGYDLTLLDAADGSTVGGGECTGTTCTLDTPGNGRDHAVIVRVQARNAIGLSSPVDVPGAVWSDVVPGPPSGLEARPLDGRLRVEWRPVDAGGGSAVGSYVVTVAGAATEVDAGTVCTASLCAFETQPLANGSQVPVSVSARNQAYPALASWTEAGTVGTPFGAPLPAGIQVIGDAASGTVTVLWSPFEGNGDGVGGYFVQQLVAGETAVPSGPQACRVTSPAPGQVVPPTNGGSVERSVATGPDASSVQFSGTSVESAQYSFVVWGYNRAGCSHTEVAAVVVRPAPGPVGGVASDMAWQSETTFDRYVSGVQGSASTVQIVATDRRGVHLGEPRTFSGTGWLRELLGRPFGETAYFQVRSCAVWGSCGPWSETIPGGESPSLTFAVPGRTWNEQTGSWSWAGPPANGGLPASFRCGVEGDEWGRHAQGSGSCQVPGARPGDRVWLDVEVAGVTATFWNR